MLAATVMALLLNGALPEMPPPSDAAWTQSNADATYVGTQTQHENGCHFQVVHQADQSVVWSQDVCFGGKSDGHFLSADGQKLMVVASFPEAAKKGAANWAQSPVVWLFSRDGLLAQAQAGALVRHGSDVRRDVHHFSWLQGVNGVPGVPPRLNEGGTAVELDAIDGTHVTLKFDGFAVPARPLFKKHEKHNHHRR